MADAPNAVPLVQPLGQPLIQPVQPLQPVQPVQPVQPAGPVVQPTTPQFLVTPATVGTPLDGELVGGSPNIHPLSLVGGVHYIFDVKGGIDGALGDSILTLRDTAGNVLQTNDDVDPGHILDSRIEFTPALSGTFNFVVSGFSGENGTYTFLSRVDDFADDILTTKTAAPGAFTNGVIERGEDQDFFSVQLIKGTNYNFNVQASAAPGGLVDTTLTLLDPNGKALASDVNGGDSVINFTATVSGEHFLDVGSLGNTTGQYLLIA